MASNIGSKVQSIAKSSWGLNYLKNPFGSSSKVATLQPDDGSFTANDNSMHDADEVCTTEAEKQPPQPQLATPTDNSRQSSELPNCDQPNQSLGSLSAMFQVDKHPASSGIMRMIDEHVNWQLLVIVVH